MTLNIRRVVTDHDDKGRAVVSADETRRGVSARPGHERCDLWQSPDGIVFRLVEYQPGVAPRNHRTETIDYAVVLSGEIEMDLDGKPVRLKQGDALVQRNTIHNWINRGPGPCVIAFVLVPLQDAKPALG
ncbi:MAG TPA: cupin domain-containing protein [Burkholderiales bacterium]